MLYKYCMAMTPAVTIDTGTCGCTTQFPLAYKYYHINIIKYIHACSSTFTCIMYKKLKNATKSNTFYEYSTILCDILIVCRHDFIFIYMYIIIIIFIFTYSIYFILRFNSKTH